MTATQSLALLVDGPRAARRHLMVEKQTGGWTTGWVAPEDREPCIPCGGTGLHASDAWYGLPRRNRLQCGACHGEGYWRVREGQS